MFKQIFAILKNQAKIRALDVALEVLINALQEFRRSQKSGQFDVNNQSAGTPATGQTSVTPTSDFLTKFNSKNLDL